MSQHPDTRPSLIARLRDSDDREAWYEFVDIYRPVILRLARFKGLQEADAEDLVQKVFVSMAGAIERWEVDQSRARFRSWLRRIAENAILNTLTRKGLAVGSGDSGVGRSLENISASLGPDSELLRIELRREVFRYAAEHIRPEFRQGTWQAFWLSCVEGRDVEEVAKFLGKTKGSVYAARSRVMRRLKEVVLEYAPREQPKD